MSIDRSTTPLLPPPVCVVCCPPQMLVVLRAESWPAFDPPELEELEGCILDEAAELFGETASRARAT